MELQYRGIVHGFNNRINRRVAWPFLYGLPTRSSTVYASPSSSSTSTSPPPLSMHDDDDGSSAPSSSSSSSSPLDAVAHQISLDVRRSMHFDICQTWGKHTRHQRHLQLTRTLLSTFPPYTDSFPFYVQGAHDVASVLLLALGGGRNEEDEAIASQLLAILAQSQLRGYLQRDMMVASALLNVLDDLVATADSALHAHMSGLGVGGISRQGGSGGRGGGTGGGGVSSSSSTSTTATMSRVYAFLSSSVLGSSSRQSSSSSSSSHHHHQHPPPPPIFALSWILTWFSHANSKLVVVLRLFDAFLCAHPLFPVYVSAALLLHFREDILRIDDEGELLMFLQVLPERICSNGDASGITRDGREEGGGGGSGVRNRKGASVVSSSTPTGNDAIPLMRRQLPVSTLIDTAISLYKANPPVTLLGNMTAQDTSLLAAKWPELWHWCWEVKDPLLLMAVDDEKLRRNMNGSLPPSGVNRKMRRSAKFGATVASSSSLPFMRNNNYTDDGGSGSSGTTHQSATPATSNTSSSTSCTPHELAHQIEEKKKKYGLSSSSPSPSSFAHVLQLVRIALWFRLKPASAALWKFAPSTISTSSSSWYLGRYTSQRKRSLMRLDEFTYAMVGMVVGVLAFAMFGRGGGGKI